MLKSKKKKPAEFNQSPVIEDLSRNNKIRRLDRIYVIIAFILLTGWGILNFSSLKLPAINFNFISDYFSERASLKSEDFISWDRYRGALVQGEYIYYLNQNAGGLFKIKKDGTDNKKIISGYITEFYIKNDSIYYVNSELHLMKCSLEGSGISEISRTQAFNDIKIFDNLIYSRSAPGMFTKVSLDGKPVGTMEVNEGTIAVLPYGNFMYEFDLNSFKAFKSRIGSSDKTEASSFERGFHENLGFYRGWLYYIDSANTLCRRKIDGSQDTKIDGNVESFSLDRGMLYYAKLDASVPEKSSTGSDVTTTRIFVAEADGSNKREVCSENNYSTYIGGDIIINSNPYQNKLSFTNVKTGMVINIPEPEYIPLVKNIVEKLGYSNNIALDSKDEGFTAYKSAEYIYYNNIANNIINRYNLTSKESSPVLSGGSWNFSIVGDTIFHKSDIDGGLYYSRTDGSMHEQLFDTPVYYFTAAPEALYFTSFDSRLHKLDFNTGKVAKLSDDEIYNRFIIKGGYIYYCVDLGLSAQFTSSSSVKAPDFTKIFRIKLDGTCRESMDWSNDSGKFDVVGDYIYFLREDLASGEHSPVLCRQKFGSYKAEIVIKNCLPDYMFSGNHIFCHTFDNPLSSTNPNYRLLMYTLDGKFEKAYRFTGQQYAIDGDTIYSMDYTGKLEALKLRDIEIK